MNHNQVRLPLKIEKLLDVQIEVYLKCDNVMLCSLIGSSVKFFIAKFEAPFKYIGTSWYSKLLEDPNVSRTVDLSV